MENSVMDSAIDILSFSYMHENAIGSRSIAYNLAKTLNASNIPCRAFVIKSYEKRPYVVGLDNIDPFFRYQRYFLALLRKSGLIKNHIQRKLLSDAFAHALNKKVTGAKLLLATNENVASTFRMARKRGIQTACFLGNPHADFTLDLAKEERDRWSARHSDFYTSEFSLKSLRSCYKVSNHLICCSSTIYDSFVGQDINREKLIYAKMPNGIEPCQFYPLNQSNNKKFQVFYIAHSTLLKGLQYLLQAWQRLELKEAELVIAGSMDKNVCHVIKEHFASLTNVNYVGAITNTRDYYQQASVVALPSLADGNARTVWEAMTCGKPVIITENCGNKDFVTEGEDGFIVPIRDANAIAEKIEYLYNNRDKCKRMGQNAHRKLKQYPIQYTARQLSQVLLNLIERN